MDLQVAKWGNSLALRIPAEYVRSVGIKEGDRLEACLTVDGGLTIRPATWSRKDFSRTLATARASMPMGKSVMDEVRRGGRY
jgi:antitoxin MazE